MKRKTLMGARVKRVLSNVSDSGNRHLAEIETDLAQTNYLLGGAIEKLGNSFMAIHAAIAAQQQAVDMLLAGAAPSPEIVGKLEASRNEIDSHVNAAVTGLQFQDMTSQLIARIVTRIAGMREVLDGIGAGSAALVAGSDAQQIAATLSDINKLLEAHGAQLDGSLWKAVQQTHMESGDVELF